MPSTYSGQTAYVTGGASGIARALTQRLVDQGSVNQQRAIPFRSSGTRADFATEPVFLSLTSIMKPRNRSHRKSTILNPTRHTARNVTSILGTI